MAELGGLADPDGRDKSGLSISDRLATGARHPVRLPYLDGLRGVASAYVVAFHAVLGFAGDELTGAWRIARRAFAFGHEAVAIFIVLSGYCLMLPVVQRRPERLTAPFTSFMRRRALRILPPYFAMLAVSLALQVAVPALRRGGTGTIWDDSANGLEPGAIATHLLLVHNWFPAWGYRINGPLWSVASEWQIYFLFPLLLLPLWERWGMLTTLMMAAALGYAPLLFAPAQASIAIPWYLLLFTFGMSAAAIGFSQTAAASRLRAGVAWGLVCGSAWALCVTLGMAAAPLWFSHKPLADLLVGVATATLLIYLTSRAVSPTGARGLLLLTLESRALVTLGHFSYSLYLSHLPVIASFFLVLRPLALAPGPFMLLLLASSGVTSLAVGYVFHLAIERPFLVRR